jgi:hypothetical protein
MCQQPRTARQRRLPQGSRRVQQRRACCLRGPRLKPTRRRPASCMPHGNTVVTRQLARMKLHEHMADCCTSRWRNAPRRSCIDVPRQHTGQRMHQGGPLLVRQLPRGALQPGRHQKSKEQLVLLEKPALHACKHRTRDRRSDVSQALLQGCRGRRGLDALGEDAYEACQRSLVPVTCHISGRGRRMLCRQSTRRHGRERTCCQWRTGQRRQSTAWTRVQRQGGSSHERR